VKAIFGFEEERFPFTRTIAIDSIAGVQVGESGAVWINAFPSTVYFTFGSCWTDKLYWVPDALNEPLEK